MITDMKNTAYLSNFFSGNNFKLSSVNSWTGNNIVSVLYLLLANAN